MFLDRDKLMMMAEGHICWFCRKVIQEDERSLFTFEWDAYFHISCEVEQIEQDNPEALIIDDEFKKAYGDEWELIKQGVI